MHSDHVPSFVCFFLKKCMQEGMWSMHISKFFYLILIYGDTFSMHAWCIPYSGKVWWGECLANLLFSSILQKKGWRMNRSAKGLLIITTTLDGFSLVNLR